jgi:hypothetical protein
MRLAFVVAAGSWLTTSDAGYQNFFLLAGSAMVVFGLFTAVTVWATSWGSERNAVAAVA